MPDQDQYGMRKLGMEEETEMLIIDGIGCEKTQDKARATRL